MAEVTTPLLDRGTEGFFQVQYSVLPSKASFQLQHEHNFNSSAAHAQEIRTANRLAAIFLKSRIIDLNSLCLVPEKSVSNNAFISCIEAIYASMSGSGASVYGLFNAEQQVNTNVFGNCFVYETLLD